MLNILSFLVVRMNESIELPELEFESTPNAMILIDLANGLDDIEAMFQIALMVVCQVVDKQVFEIELLQNYYLKI